MPRVLLAVLATGALAGCASPDDPTLRRPIIPQPVQDLAARQQGNAAVLSFTLPAQSTRREPLAEPPAIEIYRGVIEPGGRPPERTETELVYTIPGELANSYQEDGRIVYRDVIEPGELASAPGTGAGRIYAVRTRAERNRASAESNRVVVRTYAPPEPVGEVNVVINRAAPSVSLMWAPAGVTMLNRVYRAEIAPESAAAAAQDASQASLRTQLAMIGEVTSSPGTGTLQMGDANVEFGRAYLYIVRRVAQFGPDTVESADSKPAVVTVAEVVLPAVPQGVEAVVVPASAQAAASVSLSWAISAEAGVAGYAVYRSEQPETPGTRLNEGLLGAPTYRDLSVVPGRGYFYRVTAVDGAGQESAPSAATEAQIPGQQP